MGATCLPEIISLYTGVNVYEYLIRLALGETVEFAAANQCAAAARLLRSERSGVLEAVYVPDWIKQHPELVDLSFDYQPGEQVNKFTVGPDRIGQLIVRGGNRAEAEDLAEKMVADIEIKVKDAEE